jgi:Calcineurin-like phosphoesterase
MKVLFTADIHIKLGAKNVPINWAKNRYRMLFLEIAKLSKECDLTVIGGDIFDRLPSIEELELYFELVESIQSDAVIYSGNHEAVKKNTTFLSSLERVTMMLNYRVEIVDDFYTRNGIDFIPYNKLKEPWPDFHCQILCTHVRAEIPPHVKAEIPLEYFDKWKVVLAGDLHSYDNSQRNILYPGSPITTSFHRNFVDTGIILFDTDTLEHKWIKLDLPQLIRKTIKAGEPMFATEFHHTIYELEGDMAELSDAVNSDLLDKKILKRDTDTALILSNELSIEEEVEEYLTYVLKLNDDAIREVLRELNNHVEKFKE